MAFYICIDVSRAKNSPRVAEDGKDIIHVKFREVDREKYEVNYEPLENTLLTEYLKKCHGADFNQKLMKLTFDITPPDEANNFCRYVLEKGILCQKQTYFFLGHSDEQLKKKSCYLMRANNEEIHELFAKFGDFLEEKHLGKRARKIGMLFSTLTKTVPLAATEYKVQPDVKRGFFRSYTFTDGCGFMSPGFSSEVQRILKLDYQPSAVQIRYRGIEGMLVVKEDLVEVKLLFHTSMQKFVTPDESTLEDFSFAGVVDYSRPYVNGYLDTRMVMLLAAAGVPPEHLEDLQSDYHDLLRNMCNNTAYAENFLRFKGGDGATETPLKALRKQEIDEMNRAAYTRILVPKSRLVFAVCDPYNKLKYGECYFNPTTLEDETRDFLTGQKFVVMRHPCYHPGDVRVLRLTKEKQEYENLRDCLVLPVKGPRPHAFECSGGDLSGNKFFVSWDDKLIPNKMKSPCGYPPKRTPGNRMTFVTTWLFPKVELSPDRRNEEGRKEIREYFASFKDDLTEMIDATYMKYAAAFGPSSNECRKLSKMFYQATDFTQDRVALEKKWLKLKKTEPRAKGEVLSSDKAPFSETSRLINSTEEEENAEDQISFKTFRQRRLFKRRHRPVDRHANKVREKIDKEAERFAKTFSSERKKIA